MAQRKGRIWTCACATL